MTLPPQYPRLILWFALALLAWAVLAALGPVLLPFVSAAVMAYVLHPLVGRLQRWRVPRSLGAALAVAGLMAAGLAVLLLIVPMVALQWPLLRDQIPLLLEHLNARLQGMGWAVQVDVAWVRATLAQWLAGQDSQWLQDVLASVLIGGSSLLALLGNVVLMPIVAYYLLLDGARGLERVMALVPPAWQHSVARFLAETDTVLGQYLRGQMLVMGALALFYMGGLWLVGLDLAWPLGLLTGVAVFVPYLGFGLSLLLGLLAAGLQFQTLDGVLLVALVYLLGQGLESFYLTPRWLGERIGLHPLAVIFALMAFGHVLGFVGVLVALPASAVLLVALRRAQSAYLASSLYHAAAPPAATEQERP